MRMVRLVLIDTLMTIRFDVNKFDGMETSHCGRQ